MTREKVDSSNLQSVGYDSEKEVLEVEFKGSGDVWQYTGVSPQRHRALVDADSIGGYFQKNIRKNKDYTARKVG